MSQMSRSLDDLLPVVADSARELLRECTERGFPIFITSTLRTFSEQAQLYAQGRTEPGRIVTNAREGESPHNYGLAFDVAFHTPPATDPYTGPWDAVGAQGKALGLEWGGDWKHPDRPHFQARSPVSTRLRKAALFGELRVGGGAPKRTVMELQNALIRIKCSNGGVNGTFDPLTENAVMALQRRFRLLPTGIIGPQEVEALVWAMIRMEATTRNI